MSGVLTVRNKNFYNENVLQMYLSFSITGRRERVARIERMDEHGLAYIYRGIYN